MVVNLKNIKDPKGLCQLTRDDMMKTMKSSMQVRKCLTIDDPTKIFSL